MVTITLTIKLSCQAQPELTKLSKLLCTSLTNLLCKLANSNLTLITTQLYKLAFLQAAYCSETRTTRWTPFILM